jgi:hypothetical protein
VSPRRQIPRKIKEEKREEIKGVKGDTARQETNYLPASLDEGQANRKIEESSEWEETKR